MICPRSQGYWVVEPGFEPRQPDPRALDLGHHAVLLIATSTTAWFIERLLCAWFSPVYTHRADFTPLGNHKDTQNWQCSLLAGIRRSNPLPTHRPVGQWAPLLTSPRSLPGSNVDIQGKESSKDVWTLGLRALTRTKPHTESQDAQ